MGKKIMKKELFKAIGLYVALAVVPLLIVQIIFFLLGFKLDLSEKIRYVLFLVVFLIIGTFVGVWRTYLKNKYPKITKSVIYFAYGIYYFAILLILILIFGRYLSI